MDLAYFPWPEWLNKLFLCNKRIKFTEEKSNTAYKYLALSHDQHIWLINIKYLLCPPPHPTKGKVGG